MLAAIAVGLGALGAHALKARLTADMLAVWHTAAQYHAWHALALVVVGASAVHMDSAWLRAAGWLLVTGIALFSGSLYALALGAPRALGAITPLGGVALILAWLAFAIAALRA